MWDYGNERSSREVTQNGDMCQTSERAMKLHMKERDIKIWSRRIKASRQRGGKGKK